MPTLAQRRAAAKARGLIFRPAEINDSPSIDLTPDEQQEWLNRSQEWPGLDKMKWRATKVLGRGGNGVCGLWKRLGRAARFPAYMVVKQSRGEISLRRESKYLRRLYNQVPKSKHILKLYAGTHWEGGSGTHFLPGGGGTDRHPYYDHNGNLTPHHWHSSGVVSRIYMEYFPNGDLDTAISKPATRNLPVPEEYIWRVMECLASAILMIETGSETPAAQPWHYPPLIHLDIKDDNIFVGEHDDEHSRLGRFVLADFGLAQELPQPNHPHYQDFLDTARYSGTTVWHAPEQFCPPLLAQVDEKMNTWGIGVICYWLITREPPHHELPDDQIRYRTYNVLLDEDSLGLPQGTIRTHGSRVVSTELFRRYSKKLTRMMQRCLAHKSQDRPSAEEILKYARIVLKQIRHMHDVEPVEIGDGGGSVLLNKDYRRPRLPHGYDLHEPPEEVQQFTGYNVRQPRYTAGMIRWEEQITPEDKNNELLFEDNLPHRGQVPFAQYPALFARWYVYLVSNGYA